MHDAAVAPRQPVPEDLLAPVGEAVGRAVAQFAGVGVELAEVRCADHQVVGVDVDPALIEAAIVELQDAVRAGRLSVSPVTALHRTDTLPRTYRLLRMLPPEAMHHGVGPIVLMNYGLVVREPHRHRHTPQPLVWLGGDDLPGQARSTTSRLRDTDPHTLSHGHALAYDALDVLAAI